MRGRSRAIGIWLGCCWAASGGVIAANAAQAREERPPSVSRPAWTWTVDERLDRRFDPANSTKRREGQAGGGSASNLVDGAQDPQLLLPHEVFDHLLTKAFFSRPEEAAQAREEIAGAARLRGLGDGFLDDLGRLAADYLQVRHAQDVYPTVYATTPNPEKEKVSEEMDRAWYAVCRARNEALQAVRSLHGEETFYRFLYEAVAPSMTVRVADASLIRDRLRFEAQGCPTALKSGAGDEDTGVVPKPAWEWTLAERLDALFEPVENRRRLEAHAYKMRRPVSQSNDSFLFVDGSRNPELLFPHELFERLVTKLFFTSDPEILEHWRGQILAKARQHGLGDALLEVLEKQASGYMAFRRQQKEMFARYPSNSPEDKRRLEEEEERSGRTGCAEGKRALDAVRSYFGQEKFDRFLYEVIAPGISTFTRDPDQRGKMQIQYVEEGCP